MKVSIIGSGYVGLTTGTCLAWLGHDVTCIDSDATKIEKLRAGHCPIFEPYLEDMLKEAMPRLQFVTTADSIAEADVVFIAVGTPPQPNGSPDLKYLRSAAEMVGKNLNAHYTVVVNKSTVPIGCGNWVGALIKDAYETRHPNPKDSFAVASNPEFLREGAAIHDSLYPDRVVIGSDDPRALGMLYALYRPVLEQTFTPPANVPRPEHLGAVPVIATDLTSAELIKYAANAFLALKISYINEIGHLAEKAGADIKQVAKGIGLDARIGNGFLQAGVGWGGSCFGKDTAALISTAGEYGVPMPIVAAAREVNNRQRERLVEKLLGELKILKGRTIGLLGLAFKPNTDDLREAPALSIIQKLLDLGCNVKAHDPAASERFRAEHGSMAVKLCDSPEQVVDECDAVVLMTDWQQYRDLPWAEFSKRMQNPLLLDGRSFFSRQQIEQAGFTYLAFGA
ncbi:MAG: UDP-glucose/GDP-mannose dehydrogenase family protein [Acidobacteriota bacterium]